MAENAVAGRRGLALFFDFERVGTNTRTEVLAGLSTYLALTPSFILIPTVLAKSGLDPSAVLFAVVVAGSIATIAMGLWANLPFAVSAGIETAGFFAFVICGTLRMPWQAALGAVFISGLLCLLFTAVRVRKDIIDAIPNGLKAAIGTSVGVFVATLGLNLANIVLFKDGRVDFSSLNAASFIARPALVLYAGLLLSFAFGATRLKFPGGMLVAIIASALVCAALGMVSTAAPAVSVKMLSAVGKLNLSIALDPRFWSPILVLFVIDFLGGIGKFIGLTANTNIQDAGGNVPHLSRALYVDGAGTVLGSLLGTSSLIAFIESAVGIKAGGRTGLTAVVCGLLMAASIALAPVMQWIPAQAIAGVLLFVGYLLLPGVGGGRVSASSGPFDIGVAVVMGGVAFFTLGLDKALALGFWAYFAKSFTDPSARPRDRFWLGLIAAVLTGTIVWQLFTAS
jgi:AGZA family xanthine/uracil permease-like MFS transporter